MAVAAVVGGGGFRNQQNGIPLNRNHVFDSSGPEMRVRGTAQQLYDKYQQLARDASSNGDRVTGEAYYQHAEHYFRIISAINQAQGLQNPQAGQQNAPQERGFGGQANSHPAEHRREPQTDLLEAGETRPQEPRAPQEFRSDNRDNREPGRIGSTASRAASSSAVSSRVSAPSGRSATSPASARKMSSMRASISARRWKPNWRRLRPNLPVLASSRPCPARWPPRSPLPKRRRAPSPSCATRRRPRQPLKWPRFRPPPLCPKPRPRACRAPAAVRVWCGRNRKPLRPRSKKPLHRGGQAVEIGLLVRGGEGEAQSRRAFRHRRRADGGDEESRLLQLL